MKATHISLFLLFLYVSISIVNSSGVYNSEIFVGSNPAYNSITSDFQEVYNQTNGSAYKDISADDYGFRTSWNYFTNLWGKLKNFFSLSLNFGGFLNSTFHAPTWLTIPLNIIIYVIYMLSVLEIFAGKKVL